MIRIDAEEDGTLIFRCGICAREGVVFPETDYGIISWVIFDMVIHASREHGRIPAP